MRQLYPILWVATVFLAAAMLLRTGGLGALLATAAHWEPTSWSEWSNPLRSRPAAAASSTERPAVELAAGYRPPNATPRPAAWPSTAPGSTQEPCVETGLDNLGKRAAAESVRRLPGSSEHQDNSQPPPVDSVSSVRRLPESSEAPGHWSGLGEPLAAPDVPQAVATPGIGHQGRETGPWPNWPAQPPQPAMPSGLDVSADPPPGYQPGNRLPAPSATGLEYASPQGRDGEASLRGSGQGAGVAAGALGAGSDLSHLAPRFPDLGPQSDPLVQEPATPCEGAEILGRVGSEIILASELWLGIPELRARNPHVPKEVLEAEIRKLLKQRLEQKIIEKLVCQHAQRTIPAENFPKIKENVAREFENSQIPRLMKAMKARSRDELDQMLRAAGSSLEMQKRQFIEQVLAHEWLRQQVQVDEEVSHEEMLRYYREHTAEFVQPARARWEQLTVRVWRFPNREEAYAALAEMGNMVLDGVPWAEVAKARSHGSTAQQGGYWDWTNQGSLASKVLDTAIFGDGVRPGLPIGALSPILEDGQAFHIIRVLERQEPRRTPFTEAQVEIRKKIRAEREARAREQYLAKLRQETPVWTAFDPPIAHRQSSADRFLH